MEECKLTITVDTYEDNSLNIRFDGSFLGSRAMEHMLVASIADALGMDAKDMLLVGMILHKGLPRDHLQGEQIIISTRKPEDMEDD